jgi:hypothetical protein
MNSRSVSGRRSRLARLACLVLAATVASAGQAARAEGPPADSAPAVAPYSLESRALTGPQGADVTLDVDNAPGHAAVDMLKKVQLKIFAADGKLDDVRNLTDVPARGGVANILLGEVERGRRVEADVLVQTAEPAQTYKLRSATWTRLRPDLVVNAVHAPLQTLTTRPIDVSAEIAELNGETGATATVTLLWGPTPLGEPVKVTVPADEQVSVSFTGVTLDVAAPVELSVVISHVSPVQTSETNDIRSTTVQVTEHELLRANVLVPSLGGYGAQFNQHVYAPVTNPPAATLPDMEAKVKALEPQLVRIFYNDDFEERQPNRVRNLASFYDTVQLAHEAGATINITYQAVNVARANPVASMTRFADVLEDLVEIQGYTSVSWVTVANEPNGVSVTQPEYEALYRALDAQLVERGLRERIGMMGGDLIRNNQRSWFQYIAANMNDILDAYSVHIYWDYWNTPFFTESRLKDVRKIVTEELPVNARKPTYVTEYAVRGIQNFEGKPSVESGYWADGTELSRTNIAAFQQLWFDIASVQLGFTGSIKWDAYWGKYNGSYNSVYAMIGRASEGWPLFPAYHALRLLLQTTQRGWQVLQVAPWADDDWKLGVLDEPEKELAAYADADDHLTLVGLDTNGRDLNAVSTETREYSIGGLPPLTAFTLALWNATGNGENRIAGTVTTDAVGVARFEVPLHAAFALTTVPTS